MTKRLLFKVTLVNGKKVKLKYPVDEFTYDHADEVYPDVILHLLKDKFIFYAKGKVIVPKYIIAVDYLGRVV